MKVKYDNERTMRVHIEKVACPYTVFSLISALGTYEFFWKLENSAYKKIEMVMKEGSVKITVKEESLFIVKE